ncbi:MAG: hypothetical protein NTZ09_01185 [Candidatus Hydrogenedentes bacterium]|nr:hypothetical protein [Candidatus Hydrogenedentota bacterium]
MNHLRLPGTCIAVVLAGIGVAIAQPLAVAPPKNGQDAVSMELSEMEVNEAMAALSAATGYNIILSKTITGKINAFFVDMEPERALEETIRVNGFYYEKKDKVIWVLTPEEYFEDHNLGRERRIIPLKHARAADVALVLDSAKSKFGIITAYTDTNVVVVSEMTDRVDELVKLAEGLDTPPKTAVYQLEHASAQDMLAVLQPHAATDTSLRADIRTNQILITGTDATIARLETLLKAFDKPEKILTRVFALKYAKAEPTAELLREILTGRKQSAQASVGEQLEPTGQKPGAPRVFTTEPGRPEAPATAAPTAPPAQRSAPPAAATPRASWERYRESTRPQTAAATATAPPTGAPTAPPSEEEAGIGPLATITADPRTNSVIVTHVQSVLDRVEQILRDIDIPNQLHIYQFKNADPTESGIETKLAALLGEANPFINVDPVSRKVTFRCPADEAEEVLRILEEWDQQVRQVHIEAEILRVNVRLLSELGINWDVMLDKAVDSTRVTTFQSLFQFPPNIADTAPQARLSVGNIATSDYNVLVQAIASDNDTEVIAQPKITVRSGQEAVFSEVRDEPYTVVTVAGETLTTMQDVRFLNVGVSLMVVPVINENDQVTLDVQLELSDLVEIRDNVPVVDRATAQSSVTVANGGAVILGGLRQHMKTRLDRGTPGLRKVPILGALFRTRRRDRAESEIVLILRPVIVGDSEPVPSHDDIKIPIDSSTKKTKNIFNEPIKLID